MSLWKCFWQNCFWPLMLLVLLCLAQMFWPGGEWRKIEQDVQSTVSASLQENGFSWAKVTTHNRGRDVLLNGSAPSEQAKSDALRVAAELSQDQRGNPVARVVQWEGDVVIPEPDPGKLAFSVVDGVMTLNGVVASEEQKQALIFAATEQYGSDNVVDRLAVRDNILPIDNIGQLVSEFGLKDGTLRLSLEKVLRLTGEVNSEKEKANIGDSMQALLGDRYSVNNQLAIKAPEPGNLEFLAANAKMTLAGIVASEAEEQALVAAANSIYGEESVANRLIVADNVVPIQNIDRLLISFGLNDGTLNLSADKVLKVTGEVGSEQVKATIGQNLQQVLSADYSVDNQLTIKQPTQEELNAICQAKVLELMSDSKIFFATGKADIKAESYSLLDQIVSVLGECEDSLIEVDGHTDSTGSEAFNQPLSLSRAQAVVDYLINKGIASNRLIAAGFGSSKPIADNATKDGRAVNRRIEFTVK